MKAYLDGLTQIQQRHQIEPAIPPNLSCQNSTYCEIEYIQTFSVRVSVKMLSY